VGNANLVGHLRRLIVFDLDGTLIDSRADLADAANALIAERGGEPLPADAIAGMVGDGAAMLVRRALDAAALPFDLRSVERFLELYDERLLHTTDVYPGMVPALEELSRDGVLAVLTNKPIAPTRRLLDALHLTRFFATAIGGDGPFPRKPDPAGLLHLIATHGSEAEATVLIGDSHVDLHTARAARIAICLARYGFGFDTVAATGLRGNEMVVDTPEAIPAAVVQLLAR
jgi:phosphoglycolate phosphatase